MAKGLDGAEWIEGIMNDLKIDLGDIKITSHELMEVGLEVSEKALDEFVEHSKNVMTKLMTQFELPSGYQSIVDSNLPSPQKSRNQSRMGSFILKNRHSFGLNGMTTHESVALNEASGTSPKLNDIAMEIKKSNSGFPL